MLLLCLLMLYLLFVLFKSRKYIPDMLWHMPQIEFWECDKLANYLQLSCTHMVPCFTSSDQYGPLSGSSSLGLHKNSEASCTGLKLTTQAILCCWVNWLVRWLVAILYYPKKPLWRELKPNQPFTEPPTYQTNPFRKRWDEMSVPRKNTVLLYCSSHTVQHKITIRGSVFES